MIKKIFNGKLKINKKSDKIKLSKYEDYIPLYDIYSDQIFPISKKNIYQRVINNHYRFINDEVKKWIENQFKKNKNDNLKKNLEIIDNYDLETLYQTSISVIFKYSEDLGLRISICKRNSFNKHFFSNDPYYTKDEILNLGLNMNLLKDKDIDLLYQNIIDSKTHYELCKKISKNDVSFDEILKHSNYIVKNKLISFISFYSFMGSYFMNRILRNSIMLNNRNIFYYNIIYKLSNKIKDAPKLNNDYYFYRFIWDDSFIRNLKIGETFIDKGFLSTTRDPFYSPGKEIKFGIVLAKIKIKKSNFRGLFIENFSLFPKEEEVLLPPNSKLKLISKNENFKYYHINKEYEKNITKKYEFEFVNSDFKIDEKLSKWPIERTEYESKDSYYDMNLISNDILFKEDVKDKIQLIKIFINKFGEDSLGSNTNQMDSIDNIIKIKWTRDKITKYYDIFYYWYDGTDSYDIFYKNNNKDGMFFMIYDENFYPFLNIEFGNKMVVNNLNKYYFYDKKKDIDFNDLMFITDLAKIFKYKEYQLSCEFENFSNFFEPNNDELKDYELASYTKIYNKSLYLYLKEKRIFYDNIFNKSDSSNSISTFFKENLNFKYGYWKLDKLKSTEIPEELYNKFKPGIIKSENLADFFIEIIENHFLFYKKLIDYYKPISDELYLEFDVLSFSKLIAKNSNDLNAEHFQENYQIPYNSNSPDNNKNYLLVFDQPIRRII